MSRRTEPVRSLPSLLLPDDEVRISTKGQVTIPQRIREELGLLPETEVEFTVVDGGVLLRKMAGGRARGRSLVEHMRGRARCGMTTDEIMALTRGED